MSRYIYAAITRQTEDGKLFAQAVRIPSNINLAPKIQGWKDLVIFNIMPSKAEAIKTAIAWENDYIANGTSYFDRVYCSNAYDIY